MFHAAKGEREHGAIFNRALGKWYEVFGDGSGGDDRIAPVVEADQLRQQFRAKPAPIAFDAVDGQHERLAHALRRTSRSSCPLCCANSFAKTSSADARNMTAPSGCLHAPRPRTSLAQRWSRLSSSVLEPRSAMRVDASARARRPKKQGPHCAELSDAR